MTIDTVGVPEYTPIRSGAAPPREQAACRGPLLMPMRWFYYASATLGALSPTVIFYAMHYDRRVPGTFVDFGLLIYGAGLSIIFIPLGLFLGIALAAVIHLAWTLGSNRRRRSGSTVPGFRRSAERGLGNGETEQ